MSITMINVNAREVINDYTNILIDNHPLKVHTVIYKKIHEKTEVQNQQVQGHQTVLVVANLLSNQWQNINLLDLKLLASALKHRIKKINVELYGFVGFFKYLFRPATRNELNQQKIYLKSLHEIVEKAMRNKHVEELNLMNESLTDSEELSVEGVGEDGDLKSLTEEEVSENEEENFNQPGACTPPPPPPPAPNLSARGEIPRSSSKIKFNSEPDEPLEIQVAKYHPLPNEDQGAYEQRIQLEIDHIEAYVNKMEMALKRIREVRQETIELEQEVLPQERKELREQESQIEILKENILTLSNKDKENDVVYLLYPEKDSKGNIRKLNEVPYFPQKEFNLINQKLLEGGEKALPRDLLKDRAVKFLKKQLRLTEAEHKKTKEKLTDINSRLHAIKNEMFGDLNFEKALTELSNKEQRLEYWLRGLRQRKQAIQQIEKPEPRNVLEPMENNNQAALMKEFPGYAAYRALPQNAVIVLRTAKAIHAHVLPPPIK